VYGAQPSRSHKSTNHDLDPETMGHKMHSKKSIFFELNGLYKDITIIEEGG